MKSQTKRIERHKLVKGICDILSCCNEGSRPDRVFLELQVGLLSHRLERLDGVATIVNDVREMVLLVLGKEFVDGDLKRE